MPTDEERRRRENAELLKRMREGHNLCHTGLQSFRWAPRQQIPKDRREIERLYGKAPGAADAPGPRAAAQTNTDGPTNGPRLTLLDSEVKGDQRD